MIMEPAARPRGQRFSIERRRASNNDKDIIPLREHSWSVLPRGQLGKGVASDKIGIYRDCATLAKQR